ncbi:MAG: tRNA (N6-isopentenyl adenosine(37)-C2)-methylthiotransferase MiaB [Lachnospiraceae bacterium]|nr:tRNA (N6-isopentenyl adenosine(37)-C2)-methylthiotransferase MiaB [Lachnospiraceae bacterium]
MGREESRAERLRQQYYIERMRDAVLEETAETGRAPTYYIETLGCQMNAKDSEKLAGILDEIGYVPASLEDTADFVLYNTCTVRENANLKVYGHLGHLNSVRKKSNPGMKIAVCGCMMQEPDEVQTVREKYPFVNIVFGTHNIFKLAELMYRMRTEDRMVIDVWEGTDEIIEDLPAIRKYPFKSGVNIMYGCNNFCSYCIVPYVRGRERSRDRADILSEIRALAEDGVVEVMLLGQNVNSYGKTLDPPVSFPELLRDIEQIDGIERIRFMTSHPKDLSPELIDVLASSRKICNHFHLPLQSGSDRILKAMNRHYTKEKYLQIAGELRARVPGIAVTTDIIVGFPGETEEDFLETMDVVERVRFESAFTFIYSPRTGTPAAKMENPVPEEVVKDRFNRLLARVQQIGQEESGRDEGRVLPVLVETVNHQDSRMVTGRLTNNTVVHLYGDASLIGKIVPVRLRESKGFYYIGELCRREGQAG